MRMTLATNDMVNRFGGSANFPGNTVNGSDAKSQIIDIISIIDIQNAAARISPYIKRTPTLPDGFLSERFGSNIYLKYELLQRTGAFKIRGAFNKMLMLNAEQKRLGVVAVSAGNHAQAVAFAARTLGIRGLILMPEDTPEYYLANTRDYGADVELFPTFTEAILAASCVEGEGMISVPPFDDVDVIAGQGTIGLEILQDVPQVTDVIVSIGGGGLAGGVATAIKSVKPNVRIWGVETEGTESMAKSLEADEIVELSAITSVAKTLGAPRVGKLPFELAKGFLEGVTVVSDREAVTELLYLLDRSKILTEPAASCTLAATETLKRNFGPENHVVLILCGGNIGVNELFELRKISLCQKTQ